MAKSKRAAKTKLKVRSKRKPAKRKAPVRSLDHEILRPAPVVTRINADDSVTLLRVGNPKSSDQFYVLDKMAAAFWRLLDGKKSLSRIKTALIARYKPPRARFETDVSALVRRLRREKLVL